MNNDEYQGLLHSYNSFAQDRILRVRIQKSNKKEWECVFCECIIPKGKGSAYYTGLNGGRFYDYHTCLKCYELEEGKSQLDRGITEEGWNIYE
ncbi:hypothetical protein [Paenibacillus odorifer]|uniref:hypothetical protein n=1 Tax=Paenibacillus odorifer TaxID=189426 RepID=UPI0015C2C7BA|nr:hypothetical protein [Paenibacillus odorifer]